MSAFKRKRGQTHVDKTAKKGKFVAAGGEPTDGADNDKNEVTIPPPVSMVSARYYLVSQREFANLPGKCCIFKLVIVAFNKASNTWSL